MASSIYNSLNSLYAASYSQVDVASATSRAAVSTVRDAVSYTGQESQPRRQNTQQRSDLPQERQPTFASLARPQVALGPADELSLYSVGQEQDATLLVSGEESGAQGASYSAVATQASPSASYESYRGYATQLYARTNDIAFSSQRLVNQAA